MKLEGKTAIVTGAGRNIGEEIAVLFATEGAQVAVVDMDEVRCFAVTNRIKENGGTAIPIVCDVSNISEIENMVSQTTRCFNSIDILVNNVAISDNKDIFELSVEEWRKTIDVTLSTPFYVTKQVAEWMVTNERTGKIINIGSTSGFKGRPTALAYTAAKGGIFNLTQSLAVQLAPYGITVNQVSPNMTGSPVGEGTFDRNRKVNNLVNRPGEPEEQAKAVLFLASEDASFIAGTNLFVDGGTMAMASFAAPAKRKDIS